jgi:hypothetical protein
MEKKKTVKYQAEYASEVLQTVPKGFIDKTLCGCGLTTVALESNENVIIAVPSQALIENKVVQYPNNRCNYKILGVMAGITENDVNEYIKGVDVIKIMVTYDSLYKVEHLLYTCRLIIDESDKLLSSSNLKSSSKKGSKDVDVTTKVFELAEKYKDSVSFISATPTPLEYLPKWVSEIPNVKMEWSNTTKATPILMERTYPFKSLIQEVLLPMELMGGVVLAGTTVTKAIIFMNSVTNIVKVIREAKLNTDDVAIVVGNSIKNDEKINGYNRLKDPTNLPKYTFITSTGFQGIDLVDKEAVSIVVSNTTKSYFMIDMLTDLKQAISRQRDKNNPNYNKFVYIYNQSIFNKTEEELLSDIDSRKKSITQAIKLWDFAKEQGIQDGFQYTEEHTDFITYTNFNEVTEEYILNENLFNCDRYFILHTRNQYSKGFDIKGNFSSTVDISAPQLIESVNYEDIVRAYEKGEDITKYEYKIEYYNLIQDCVKLYNKVWYNYTYAKSMVKNYRNNYGKLVVTVHSKFKMNEFYSNGEVKDKLQEIYDSLGLNRKAKATDIFELFSKVSTVRPTINGQRICGIEIIKK